MIWAGKLESLNVIGEALRYGFSRLSEVLWSIPMCSVLVSRVLLHIVVQPLRELLRPSKIVMVVDVSDGADGIGNEPIVVHIEQGARVSVSGCQVARYLMLVEAQNRFGHPAHVEALGHPAVYRIEEAGQARRRLCRVTVCLDQEGAGDRL